jgi:hypothetical protein
VSGKLVFVGLVLVAAAIVFHAAAGRYEIAVGARSPIRIDRLTGEACRYDHHIPLETRAGWVRCAPGGLKQE